MKPSTPQRKPQAEDVASRLEAEKFEDRDQDQASKLWYDRGQIVEWDGDYGMNVTVIVPVMAEVA